MPLSLPWQPPDVLHHSGWLLFWFETNQPNSIVLYNWPYHCLITIIIQSSHSSYTLSSWNAYIPSLYLITSSILMFPINYIQTWSRMIQIHFDIKKKGKKEWQPSTFSYLSSSCDDSLPLFFSLAIKIESEWYHFSFFFVIQSRMMAVIERFMFIFPKQLLKV